MHVYHHGKAAVNAQRLSSKPPKLSVRLAPSAKLCSPSPRPSAYSYLQPTTSDCVLDQPWNLTQDGWARKRRWNVRLKIPCQDRNHQNVNDTNGDDDFICLPNLVCVWHFIVSKTLELQELYHSETVNRTFQHVLTAILSTSRVYPSIGPFPMKLLDPPQKHADLTFAT